MAAKPLRYIGFDEANPGPYRRRGFYISLLILERKIPDFVTNLANLDPPILAGRWGFANNPYDEDHLLRAAVRQGASGMRGTLGGGTFDSEMSGPGLSRAPRRPTRLASGANQYGIEYDPSGGGMALRNPRDPLAMMTPKMRQEVEALRPALMGKDLVQLDLTGVITIFTPEVPPETSTPEEEAAQLPPTLEPAAPPADALLPTTPDSTAPTTPDPTAPTTPDPTAPSTPDPTAPPTTEPPAQSPAPTTPALPTTPAPSAADPSAAPPEESATPPPATPAPSQ